jgi:hypothetical protein
MKCKLNGHAGLAEKSGAVRPRGRPFQPGVSGNPGGRPKGLREHREALAAAGAPELMVQMLLRGLMHEDIEIALETYDRAAAYLYGRPGAPESGPEVSGAHTAAPTEDEIAEAQRILTEDEQIL